MEQSQTPLTHKIPVWNYVLTILIATLSALSVGYGFYFNTNNTLETHDQQINTLEKDIRLINEAINKNNTSLQVQNNELKNIDQAIEILETGLDYLFDDPKMEYDFYQQLTIAYTLKGNTKKAKLYHKKASELSIINQKKIKP